LFKNLIFSLKRKECPSTAIDLIESFLRDDWSFYLFPVSPYMIASVDALGSEHLYNKSKFLGVDSEETSSYQK
jgi:hypothetical protein